MTWSSRTTTCTAARRTWSIATASPHQTLAPLRTHLFQDVVKSDDNLHGHEAHLEYRYRQFLRTKASIEDNEGSLEEFAKVVGVGVGVVAVWWVGVDG